MKIKSGEFNASLNNVAGDASKLPYDNSESQLEATTIQEAVDEVNDTMGGIAEIVDGMNNSLISLTTTVNGKANSSDLPKIETSSSGTFNFVKYGKVVHVYSWYNASAKSYSGETTLATLPVGWRPRSYLWVKGFGTSEFRIDPNGNIQFQGPYNQGTFIIMQCTFICA